MSQAKIWTYLMFSSLLLIGVSGSLFVSFQHWVMTMPVSFSQQVVSQSQVYASPQNVVRPMISTAWEKSNDVENMPSSTPIEKPSQRVSPILADTSTALKASQPHFVSYSEPTVYPEKGIVNHSKMVSKTLLPSLVVYDNELIVEFPKQIASVQNIKNAISRVLLSENLVNDGDLLSTRRLLYHNRPYFYRKVLDSDKQPIRYPKQAYDYAQYLLDHSTEEIKDEDGDFIEIHIPLFQTGLKGPAKTYQAWVSNYATKFDINPALVYAVMETESGFNPKAVSSSNAIGLMQLKPDTAGKDVYQYIDFKQGQPSKTDLFNSENNIRMGVAYLSLLKHDYLSDIQNAKTKQMVTISSYNGGIKTVLALFGKTPEQAISRLNRLNPTQVYRKLRYDHQSDETRRYLDKVLQAETKYRALLDDA